VHDFYKCSSKFYYDFSRCKLEREEAARRGLNRRSRQIHHNSASTGQASLVVLALATLWTQKCLWDFSFGEGEWGECGERKCRFGEDAKAQELQEIEKLLQFQHFDANR